MSKRTGIRRRRWLVVGWAVALVVAALTLFLAAQHRPGWYKPARVALTDEDAVRAVRREATSTIDAFGDRLAEGKPFEFELTDGALNQVLAALPHLWPEAAEAVPQELSDLAVEFGEGWARVGAMVSTRRWQAIGGVELSVRVMEDGSKLEVAVVGASWGSLPLPRVILEPAIDRALGGGSAKNVRTEQGTEGGGGIEKAAQLYEGIAVPNRFTWPNGDRRFRVRSLEFTPGKMRVGIQPVR